MPARRLTKAEYPDFSDRKKLYTIDQLQFFSTTTAISGRKVCVSSCPAADDELCMWSEGGGYTCSETVTSKQMTCAYARYADYNYGDFQYLPASTDDWKVDYYEDITRTDMKNYSKVYGVGPCYPNWIKQDDVINRCVPALDSDVGE